MKPNRALVFRALGLTALLALPSLTFARPKVVAGRTYCDCSCQTGETNKSLAWEKVASCALNGRSCKADGKPGTLASCQECKGDSSGGYSTCNDAKKRAAALSSAQIGRVLNGMALDLAVVEEELDTRDLVPLTNPGAVPPEGLCRRNDQGQLLVKVFNQGRGDAVASKTFVSFAGAAAQSFDTPALAGRATTEFTVNIPPSCFDAENRCSFTIATDGENVVAETDEANNGVAGVCGAQFR